MHKEHTLVDWRVASKALILGALVLGACTVVNAYIPVPSGTPSPATDPLPPITVSATVQTKVGSLTVAAITAVSPANKLTVGTAPADVKFINGGVYANKATSASIRITGGDANDPNCAPEAGKVLKSIVAKDGTTGMGCWQFQ